MFRRQTTREENSHEKRDDRPEKICTGKNVSRKITAITSH
jgi:hypothetical protein